MPELNRGILIAVEGIDGSGKSILCQDLKKLFDQENIAAVLTKEPGGSALGSHIRSILQNKPTAVDPKAEYLLFAADRAQHFSEQIPQFLAEKKCIISDRSGYSSIVYQGYGRNLDIPMIESINKWAMNGIQHDLVCYVKIDLETAKKRLSKRENQSAFDRESISFFEKLIEGFNTIFANRPNTIVLDGSQSPETASTQAMEQIMAWLKEHGIVHD